MTTKEKAAIRACIRLLMSDGDCFGEAVAKLASLAGLDCSAYHALNSTRVISPTKLAQRPDCSFVYRKRRA